MSMTQGSGAMTNKQEPEMQYTIFCDLDGVLADFKKAITKVAKDVNDPSFVYDEEKYSKDSKYRNQMWKDVKTYQQKYGYVLWRELDTMPDAYVLWDYIKPYHPQILTATGQSQYKAVEQKRGWVTEHFGSNIRVNVVETAKDKHQYAGPNRILIDDQRRATDPWIAAGGIGIVHTSAASTIQKLKELGL